MGFFIYKYPTPTPKNKVELNIISLVFFSAGSLLVLGDDL